MNRAAPSTNSGLDDLATSAQGKMSSAIDSAQELAREQYDNLTLAIRRNPLQAAAIAAGIGIILALLGRR